MLYLLAGLTLLLTAADHWTTYLCLRQPIVGWRVTEANPIADWLFSNIGLVEGLAFDTVVTLGAVAFLLTTTRFPQIAKTLFFAVVVVWTGHAVINNMQALQALGLSLLGGS